MIGLLAAVVIVIAVHAFMAIGLNFHAGETGLINFGVVAFFAIGAYTSAIFTAGNPTGPLSARSFGFAFPVPIGIIAGMILAAAVALVLGYACADLRDDYFALATLGTSVIVRDFIKSQGSITGGTVGVQNIPRPLSASIPFNYDYFYVIFALGLLLVTYLVFTRLSGSAFGRVLNAIREDEEYPPALGKNVMEFKLKAFALGAAVAALGGSLFAHWAYALTPGSFPIQLTFIMWAVLIIGGLGSTFGAIAGTAIVFGIRQIVRFLPDFGYAAEIAYLRIIVIGVALILVMYYRPAGIFGNEERRQAGGGVLE